MTEEEELCSGCKLKTHHTRAHESVSLGDTTHGPLLVLEQRTQELLLPGGGHVCEAHDYSDVQSKNAEIT